MSAALDLTHVDPAAAGLSAPALARLRDALGRLVERQRLPGAVALIVRDGAVGAFDAIGWQDPARGVPMAHETIFRIFSMTKPIVSVALMRLLEQGRVSLRDPLSRYVPAFAGAQVGVEDEDGGLRLVAPRRPITLHDLLRHTAGLTYEFFPPSAVRRAYIDAGLPSRANDNARHAELLARLPLAHQPGAMWEYSRATDVLGRVVEVVSGEPLGDHLRRHVFEPLGMRDTGFAVPSAQRERIAEPFPNDPDSGAPVALYDAQTVAPHQSGGGGLVSTAADYARFAQMLLQRGRLGEVRLLGSRTVDSMTADHLGPIPRSLDTLPPGHGFGLGFAVKTALGEHTEPGSVGSYGWSGMAGTAFFVDPAERMFALLMMQAPHLLDEGRELFRQLVYAAIDD